MTVKTLAYADYLLLFARQTVAEAWETWQNAQHFFSHVIVDRQEDFGRFFYLFPYEWAFERLEYYKNNAPDKILMDAFDLHESGRTDTIESNESVTKATNDRYVVLQNGAPVGFITYDYAPKNEEPQAPPPPPPPPPPPAQEGPAGDGGRNVPEEAGAEPEEMEKAPFKAYPSISDPGNLQPEAEFSIDIGFAQEADAGLTNVMGIHIPSAAPTDFLSVKLMPNGAEVLNKAEKLLFLDLDAKVTFKCKAIAGAGEVSLTAIYTFKGQLVGLATRTIPVGQQPAVPAPSGTIPTNRCRLSLPEISFEEEAIDLLAAIHWDNVAKKLRWIIKAGKPPIDLDAEIKIDNTREFAAKLGKELAREGYKGRAAYNALRTLGQAIADHIPPEFFEALKDVRQAIGKTPKVLILTDEAYIPWELAYHPDLRLEPGIEPFLHLQTQIGRWWASDRVTGNPPTGLVIQRFSAMAADYPPDSSHNPLEEAVAEKKFLMQTFNAQEVPAKKNDLLNLTGATPPLPGHLMHMALHGFSKPDLDEQLLALEDGDLTAESLFGPYFCGDAPAIAFLFLNACQVGTAGSTLGQASGFPGVVLTKGVLGFLAPLWNVHDVVARPFSESFYKETLGKGRPVGEVLLELRRSFKFEDSLTQLAYIYYGHPALKLKKSN